MQDYLKHYQMFDFHARCVVVSTKVLLQQLQRQHGLDPITTIALGRAISCTAMLASTMKSEADFLSCSWSGAGILEKVYAECNGAGDCRGYTTPETVAYDLEEKGLIPESVSDVLGKTGTLTVTHGRRDGVTTPYTAVLEFSNGEIATDVARYLVESDQIPSAVAAGVKLSPTGEILSSGGVLVQKLAGTDLDEQVLRELELKMEHGLMISERLAIGWTHDEIVEFLQGSKDGYSILSERSLQFGCTCSREKMSAALIMLGSEQLQQIEEEIGKIETRCPFCANTEIFTLLELTVQ